MMAAFAQFHHHVLISDFTVADSPILTPFIGIFVSRSRGTVLRPEWIFISIFGFNFFSTMDFKRRKMSGCSSAPRRARHSSVLLPLLNDVSNSSWLLKLRRAKSSCKLFCNGAPVMRSRLPVLNWRKTSESFDFSFLI